jgi:tetratricopeptide (TPR) repeat protein
MEALELAGQIPSSFSTVWRAEVYFLAGRQGQALEAAEQGLSGSRQRGEQGLEAWALLILGHIAVQPHTPNAEAAQGHYRDALSLAAVLGMRPLVAHCHLGLGKLYRRTGDHAKAEEHLTTASAMYREMEMAFYLAQADAELSGVGR